MNSKEQKIKEEYKKELLKNSINEKASLEFLQNLLPHIDNNGWIDSEKDEGYSGYLMESELEIEFPLLRLKSLQGIENNLGWIKIESEDDLPKDYDSLYDVSNNQNVDTIPMTLHQVKYLYDNKKITHYQKHEKKLPPIH